MSHLTEQAKAEFKPRIVVEQLPNGTIAIESYINGARKRIISAPGLELNDIRTALEEQRAAHEAQVERAAEAAKAALRAKHIKNWDITATRHGTGFADSKIGPRTNRKAPLRANIYFPTVDLLY